ncbi:arsR family transcriptional regulator [Mycobacterium kansasii 732]|nr:arsR family transcriptional regulator [Mycobacterium avium MAV_120809_2495]ETZ56317.1 arsR family transcriptional regulator [Mycobacterium avium MAV_120709_2344]ETZ72408.1 arsR family transcriptional regulator [Mycobacterium sp. MAC_011194_8550]EUA02684.1 arsR family transcriptional regulator [Mycobacterium kansasii 824]EUA14234.1 arsR family transcriptional regulator [Mycobacterium kansasii 732]EUA22344.1 arsR family transcriptional regulator [Mycobacterium kansasii 662]KEP43638.1 ArsR fa
MAVLQRAQLVTSRRIGPWTYYKRHEKNIESLLEALNALI